MRCAPQSANDMLGNDTSRMNPAPVKISALTGLLSAIAVWLPVALCDLIDEFVLHWSPMLSGAAALSTPFVLTALYIRHRAEKKPRRRNLAVWLLCYLVGFFIIQCAVSDELLYYDVGIFVPQHPFQQFNGIEYNWLYLPAVFVFLLFLAGYYLLRWIRNGLPNDAEDS